MKTISYNNRNKTVSGNLEAIKAIKKSPVVEGKGWAFISREKDLSRLEMVEPKQKRMPKLRTVSGVVKGQVYVEGKQRLGEVVELDGGGSFILAHLPAADPPPAPLMLPGKPDCGEYGRAGWVFNAPGCVWAFFMGIENRKLSKRIMQTVNHPFHPALEKLRAENVDWPETVCPPLEMPVGYVPFVTPFPVPLVTDTWQEKKPKHAEWRVNGFAWDMTWQEWAEKLGWEGIAGECAAWFLYRYFEHPRFRLYVGPDEWDDMEV